MKDFDKSKYYLGTLCKRGHDYEGTGKSLRFIKRRGCVDCEKEYTPKKHEIICHYCGKIGYKSIGHINYAKSKGKNLYCSKECASLFLKGLTYYIVQCDYCGIDFEMNTENSSLRNYKNGKNIYCSRRCSGLARRTGWSTLPFECSFCGNKFNRVLWHKSLKSYSYIVEGVIFCSPQCNARYKSISQRVDLVCENCGKAFDRPISQARNQRRDLCSVKCRQEFLVGENSPGYKHGGYINDPVYYRRQYYQRTTHWREVIEWAEQQSEDIKNRTLGKVGKVIDLKLQFLDLQQQLRLKGGK